MQRKNKFRHQKWGDLSEVKSVWSSGKAAALNLVFLFHSTTGLCMCENISVYLPAEQRFYSAGSLRRDRGAWGDAAEDLWAPASLNEMLIAAMLPWILKVKIVTGAFVLPHRRVATEAAGWHAAESYVSHVRVTCSGWLRRLSSRLNVCSSHSSCIPFMSQRQMEGKQNRQKSSFIIFKLSRSVSPWSACMQHVCKTSYSQLHHAVISFPDLCL